MSDENRQESEPLFDDGAYQLLRSDSFLTRLGSNNFNSLIEDPVLPSTENDDAPQQHQEHHPHNQHQLQQQYLQHNQISNMQFLHNEDINDPIFISSDLAPLPLSEHYLDPTERWNQVESVVSVL